MKPLTLWLAANFFSWNVYQIQFLSSQHIKVWNEHPWQRLQFEHMRPSAQVPYLKYHLHCFKKNFKFRLPSKLSSAHFSGAFEALIISAGILCCPVRATFLADVVILRAVLAAAGKRIWVDNTQESNHHDENCQLYPERVHFVSRCLEWRGGLSFIRLF